MSDELLPYYNSELRFLREMAAEFAEANPKIAGRLRLSRESAEDPHVERLIEGFAFLTARIRHKLDDEFPELTDALLGILAPHLLAPIPSMTVVAMKPDPAIAGRVSVPRGAMIESEPVQGHVCYYRTGYPIDLWPLRIDRVSLSGRPLPAPANPHAVGAAGVLRIELDVANPELTFTAMGLDRLRLFISAETHKAQQLYELLSNHVVSVALADSAKDAAPVFLDASCVVPVGLDPEHVVLPTAPGGFAAYGLLAEYFAFPEKFLFFDLVGLDAKTLGDSGKRLEIFIYLDRGDPDLERIVSAEDFQPFAAPAINLFAHRAEPVRLTQKRDEYRLVPDIRRESAMEVYSVDAVTVANRQGQARIFNPLFSHSHHLRNDGQRYYHTMRRQSPHSGGGDDVFITLVDLEGQPSFEEDEVITADLICHNRNLPARLPYGGGHPILSLCEPLGAVKSLRCLTPPTPTIRPKRGRGGGWKLVSHLSLNHLSISGGAVGAEALKELLALHDHVESAGTRQARDKILSIVSEPATARAPAGAAGRGFIAFCSGADITLEVDDARLSGSGVFMLCAVIERFLANYCAINSFSRLRIKLRGEKGFMKTWPARSGTMTLL